MIFSQIFELQWFYLSTYHAFFTLLHAIILIFAKTLHKMLKILRWLCTFLLFLEYVIIVT
jgi:hypothetical protein